MTTRPGWRSDSPIAARTDPSGRAQLLPKQISDVQRGHKVEGDYRSSPMMSHREGSAIDTPRKATSLYSRGEKRKATSGVPNRLAENRKRRSVKQ
jgi:hypothetical protein